MTSKQAATQKRYELRQRRAGMIRKSVWVPQRHVTEFDAAVAKLKQKWAATTQREADVPGS